MTNKEYAKAFKKRTKDFMVNIVAQIGFWNENLNICYFEMSHDFFLIGTIEKSLNYI